MLHVGLYSLQGFNLDLKSLGTFLVSFRHEFQGYSLVSPFIHPNPDLSTRSAGDKSDFVVVFHDFTSTIIEDNQTKIHGCFESFSASQSAAGLLNWATSHWIGETIS